MNARNVILVSMLCVLISPTEGGFTAKDAKAAGFNWAGSGTAPDAQQLQNICDAVTDLKAVDAGAGACAMSVKMAKNFCVYSSAPGSNVAARTLPDEKDGDATGDKVNFTGKFANTKKNQPGFPPGTMTIAWIDFVALLGHEMVHTKQKGSSGVHGHPRNTEKEAYMKEKEIQEKLHGSKEKAMRSSRYLSLCAWLVRLCNNEPATKCRGFESGDDEGDVVLYFDGGNTCLYDNGQRISMEDGSEVPLPANRQGQFSFTFDASCDIQDVPDLGVVAVSGTSETGAGTVGYIEYVSIDSAAQNPIQSEAVVNLGLGVVPSRLGWDGVHGRLLIWDEEAESVRLLVPSVPSGLPDSLLPTAYATRTGYPQMDGILEIDGGPEGEVYVTQADLGSFSRAIYGNQWFRLDDANEDDVADTITSYEEKDTVGFVPCPTGVLHEGETSVEVFTPLNTQFEVWETDESGLPLQMLGLGENGDEDLFETVPMSGSLEAGQYVAIHDVQEDVWSAPHLVEDLLAGAQSGGSGGGGSFDPGFALLLGVLWAAVAGAGRATRPGART